MPQMSPINWSLVFLFTIISFLILNCLNFYSFLYFPPTKKEIKLKKICWKW